MEDGVELAPSGSSGWTIGSTAKKGQNAHRKVSNEVASLQARVT